MKDHRPQQDQRRRVGRDQPSPPPRGAGVRPRGRARDLAPRVPRRCAGLRVGCRRDGHRPAEGHDRDGAARLALPLHADRHRHRTTPCMSPRATPGDILVRWGRSAVLGCPPTPGTRRTGVSVEDVRTASSVRTPTAWNFTTSTAARSSWSTAEYTNPPAVEPAPRHRGRADRPRRRAHPAASAGVSVMEIAEGETPSGRSWSTAPTTAASTTTRR